MLVVQQSRLKDFFMKNTRLVYIDKKNLDVYRGLEPEQFKEFFMNYFTYQLGDNVEVGDFSNSALYALFKMYQEKIDINEKRWKEREKTNQENGKKSMGRPRTIVLENNEHIERIISFFEKGEKDTGNTLLNMLLKGVSDEDAEYIKKYIKYKLNKSLKEKKNDTIN